MKRERGAGSGADVAGGERDHVPDAALAVTGHRQRLRVLEQVERAAVVGDLLDAAGPRDQAELAGEDVGGAGLGVPVAGIQVAAQAPTQVGLPFFLSFEYV